ncbi:hypothetical protein ACHHYP_01297 [Achlya hypogyna]|uniref:WW domain-containing protein n=1 Tax=Achlya hypogyna TaxID=1202772 RepID=A0A1V9Z907_ACHHY|nr:hypothetical protein ACHHYP_01297 [Achlya hypogyna]
MTTYPEWREDLFGVPIDRSAPARGRVAVRPPPPGLSPMAQDSRDHRRLWQTQPRLTSAEQDTLTQPRICAFRVACKGAKATRKCYHCCKFDPAKTGLYCDECFETRHPPLRIPHSWGRLDEDELDEEKQWLAHLARHKMAQDYRELELLLEHTTSFLASTEVYDNNMDSEVDKAVADMKSIDHSIRGLMADVATQLKTRNLPQAVAVRKIQDMWKVRKARNRLRLMIQSIYAEMVDPATGQVYYLNKRTNMTRWDKPKALETTNQRKPRRKKPMSPHEAALFIQKAFRARQARLAIRRLVRSVYVRVQDPATGKYYYYNKYTNTTSWTKPKLLGSDELAPKRTQSFTPESAAAAIQRMLRCALARRQLRRLLSRVYQKILEPSLGRYYYFNVKTRTVSWERPRFVHDDQLLSPRAFAVVAAEEEAAARQQRIARIRQFSASEAASYVQRRVRVHQARKRLLQMARDAYRAVFDPTTGMYFYHNTRTGAVSWTRPSFCTDLPV